MYIVEVHGDFGSKVQLFTTKKQANDYATAIFKKVIVENFEVELSSLPKFKDYTDAAEYYEQLGRASKDWQYASSFSIALYPAGVNSPKAITEEIFQLMDNNYMVRLSGFKYSK